MRHAQLARQVQPELGQLQRDVALDLLAGDRFERVEIGAHRALRRGGVGDALAQVVEADLQALGIQRRGDDDPVGKLFASHVALRQPPQQVVTHDQAVHRPPVRQVQQRTFEQGLRSRLYGLAGSTCQPATRPPARPAAARARLIASPSLTLARFEAELDVVLAAGHRHDPEQHVAAQDRHRLPVDGGRPARVVGVAQHQPRVGRRRRVDLYVVGGVAGRRVARALPASIGGAGRSPAWSRRRPGSPPGRAETAGGSSRSSAVPRLGATRARRAPETRAETPPCFRGRGSRCRHRPGGTWSWSGRTVAAARRRRRRRAPPYSANSPLGSMARTVSVVALTRLDRRRSRRTTAARSRGSTLPSNATPAISTRSCLTYGLDGRQVAAPTPSLSRPASSSAVPTISIGCVAQLDLGDRRALGHVDGADQRRDEASARRSARRRQRKLLLARGRRPPGRAAALAAAGSSRRCSWTARRSGPGRARSGRSTGRAGRRRRTARGPGSRGARRTAASCSRWPPAAPNGASRSAATWFSTGEASTRFGAASSVGSCSTAWTAGGSAASLASGSRGWICPAEDEQVGGGQADQQRSASRAMRAHAAQRDGCHSQIDGSDDAPARRSAPQHVRVGQVGRPLSPLKTSMVVSV